MQSGAPGGSLTKGADNAGKDGGRNTAGHGRNIVYPSASIKDFSVPWKPVITLVTKLATVA